MTRLAEYVIDYQDLVVHFNTEDWDDYEAKEQYVTHIVAVLDETGRDVTNLLSDQRMAQIQHYVDDIIDPADDWYDDLEDDEEAPLTF